MNRWLHKNEKKWFTYSCFVTYKGITIKNVDNVQIYFTLNYVNISSCATFWQIMASYNRWCFFIKLTNTSLMWLTVSEASSLTRSSIIEMFLNMWTELSRYPTNLIVGSCSRQYTGPQLHFTNFRCAILEFHNFQIRETMVWKFSIYR